jgi:hypothetical protein
MRRRIIDYANDAGHERERPEFFIFSKYIDLGYCAGGFCQSLRYMDAYRQGATGRAAGGVCQQEVHQQPLPSFPLRG